MQTAAIVNPHGACDAGELERLEQELVPLYQDSAVLAELGVSLTVTLSHARPAMDYQAVQ